jgi:hypothetical protein
MTDEELLRDGTLPVFARREHLLVDCISGPQRSRIFAEAEAAVQLQVAILAVLAGVTSSCH